MMYKIKFTSQFKKSLKRCQKRGLDMSKIPVVVDLLASTGSLPKEYRPHKLVNIPGNNTWECHIQPDWLLVWEQYDSELILIMINTGSHSDLF